MPTSRSDPARLIFSCAGGSGSSPPITSRPRRRRKAKGRIEVEGVNQGVRLVDVVRRYSVGTVNGSIVLEHVDTGNLDIRASTATFRMRRPDQATYRLTTHNVAPSAWRFRSVSTQRFGFAPTAAASTRPSREGLMKRTARTASHAGTRRWQRPRELKSLQRLDLARAAGRADAQQSLPRPRNAEPSAASGTTCSTAAAASSSASKNSRSFQQQS